MYTYFLAPTVSQKCQLVAFCNFKTAYIHSSPITECLCDLDAVYITSSISVMKWHHSSETNILLHTCIHAYICTYVHVHFYLKSDFYSNISLCTTKCILVTQHDFESGTKFNYHTMVTGPIKYICPLHLPFTYVHT